MNKKIFIIGLIIFIIFLLAKLYMLLLFPIAIMVFSSSSIRTISNRIKIPIILKLVILGILTGILTEILAIIDNWHLPVAEKALFHADPVINILLGLGYYIPLFAVWYFLFKKYDYKTSEVFFIGGLLGIFAEQVGAVFLSFNIFAWAYAFLVHGAILAIPFHILKDEFHPSRKSKFIKYLLGILPTIASFIIGGLWITILGFA